MDCEDRFEIENLLEAYCWTIDNRDWQGWAESFTPDGVFQVRGEQLIGHSAIVKYVQASVGDYELLRHLQHHPSVRILSETAAEARSYFTLIGRTSKGRDVEALGYYEDKLTKTGQGWKLAQRSATFDYFVRAGEPRRSGGDR